MLHINKRRSWQLCSPGHDVCGLLQMMGQQLPPQRLTNLEACFRILQGAGKPMYVGEQPDLLRLADALHMRLQLQAGKL